MKSIAIFRFSRTEGPGHFGEWLDSKGFATTLVALDRGETVPADSRAFSGIGMMGGPMSVNDDLPWKAPLLDLLRNAVTNDVPVIGHCLGGQLFAKALGGDITRTPSPEIGWSDVTIVDGGGAGGSWFDHRAGFRTFQWHYDVFSLPPGASRVLTNAYNAEQAYALGKHIGFQCHIEMTRDMVETWCRTGADELPRMSAGALQSRADIFADVDAKLASLSKVADGVYAQWARGLAT